MNWKKCRIEPGQPVRLSKMSTVAGKLYGKKELKEKLAAYIDEIADLQNRLYAENRQSLLIIFQGMDSSGKDSTIKQIMRGINPQGIVVYSFKHPSELELEHDYLWRHVQKLPEHGQIVVFNRSHYENVLISKVHPKLLLAERLPGIDTIDKVNEEFWRERYAQINYFEKNTTQNGTQVLKFFLHISKEEQRNRFLERINNREKHWKFSSADITERSYWNAYQDAYEQALENTSTEIAPWFAIPADDKPHAHLLIAKIVAEKLRSMDPRFPQIDTQEKKRMGEAKKKLLKEK